MRFPDKFKDEMEGFFQRHKEITEEGFWESFDEQGFKGIRFSTWLYFLGFFFRCISVSCDSGSL